MNIPDKYRLFLRVLLNATRDGKADWNATSLEDQFIYHMSSGAVAVEHDVVQHKLEGTYEAPEDTYDVIILGEGGETIHTIRSRQIDDSKTKRLLESLYEAAQSAYMESDNTVDVMLEEMEARGVSADLDDDEEFL